MLVVSNRMVGPREQLLGFCANKLVEKGDRPDRPDPVDAASLVIVAHLAVPPTPPARRSSGRPDPLSATPAAPARRVSTLVVACATVGPLGYPCTPSAVHHRCSSVFSRRVAPARTTASRPRRATAPPSRPCARLAPSRRTPALPSRRSACSTPPPAPLRHQRRSAAFHSALLLSPSAAFHLQSLKP
ncbi:hypothetical protein U1Q18_034740 [Sarracenia purpurea var. burkii]